MPSSSSRTIFETTNGGDQAVVDQMAGDDEGGNSPGGSAGSLPSQEEKERVHPDDGNVWDVERG